VFATLIVPPLATRRMARHRLPAAWTVGAVGYAAGLVVSTLFDLPSGPVIVWTLVVVALFANAILAPRAAATARV
jgi:zinc/manganese transport system permease protein